MFCRPSGAGSLSLAARGESTIGRAHRYCGQDQGARRRRCGDIVDDEQRRDWLGRCADPDPKGFRRRRGICCVGARNAAYCTFTTGWSALLFSQHPCRDALRLFPTDVIKTRAATHASLCGFHTRTRGRPRACPSGIYRAIGTARGGNLLQPPASV